MDQFLYRCGGPSCRGAFSGLAFETALFTFTPQSTTNSNNSVAKSMTGQAQDQDYETDQGWIMEMLKSRSAQFEGISDRATSSNSQSEIPTMITRLGRH